MKHETEYIEALKAEGFEQNPTNKYLWAKVIDGKQYGVMLKGTEPEAFYINDDFEHVNDPTDKNVKEILTLLNKAVMGEKKQDKQKQEKPPEKKVIPNHKTPSKKKPEPKQETETEEESQQDVECAICGDKLDDNYVMIKDKPVCEHCNECLANGEIAPPDELKTDDSETETVQGKVTVMENEQSVQPANINTIGKRIKGIEPQLCECGKIKIGKKGQSKKTSSGKNMRLPSKLDHFEVTTTEKDENGDFVLDQNIMAKIGDNCRELPVRLLHDNPEKNFMTSFAYYDSAACICRGDGEWAVDASGEVIECDPEVCPYFQKKKCKPNGILSVLLEDAPRVGGVYKFRTTGWNSIRNILSAMEFIKGLSGGVLAGLPLVLTVQPKTTVIPGTKTPTTIYTVNLEYQGSIGEMLNLAKVEAEQRIRSAKIQNAIDEQDIALLQAPESTEECLDVTEEFYPDNM